MSDLRTRFRGAAHVPAPDLWEDIARREPRPARTTLSGSRRLIVVVGALAVAVVAIAFAVQAFTGSRRPSPGGEPFLAPATNGPIWALGAGGEAGSLIYAIDPATGRETPLWSDGRASDFSTFKVAPELVAANYDYSFSPDGSRVAFSGYVQGPGSCCIELFVMKADGTELTQVTHDHAYDSFPSWSPDGSLLVFASYRGTNYESGCELTATCPADLYVTGVDGTGEHQLTNDAADQATPSWSPDGTKVLYVDSRGNSHRSLWEINADGTDARAIVPSDGRTVVFPEWSPDGSRVLYLAAATGERFGVWAAKADGSDAHEVVETNADTTIGRPVWSPDGKKIAYAKIANGEAELWIAGADGTEARQLAVLPRYGIKPLAWQPIPARLR